MAAAMLTITDLLTRTDIDIGRLTRITKDALPFNVPI